jgi:hypothetical protein
VVDYQTTETIMQNVIDLTKVLVQRKKAERKYLKGLKKDMVECLKELDERIARTSAIVPRGPETGKTRAYRGRIDTWPEMNTGIRNVVAVGSSNDG